jgi:hypothetical protein
MMRAPTTAGVPFNRFSRDTQQVLAAATDQARQLGHREVRPEHVLLALLLETGDRTTRAMLRVAGGDRRALVGLRESLLDRLRSIPGGESGELQLSDGCKQVLQVAIDETSRTTHSSGLRVEPRHLLIGLISEGSALLGSSLTTNLALRALRMAVGTGILRPGPPSREAGRYTGFLLGEEGKLPPPHRVETSPAPPAPRDNVITFRVTDTELAAIDTLVDTGAMRTRSEASGWLVQSGIAANADFFDQIRSMSEEIARLRQEVQRLAESRIGSRAAE